MDLGSSTTLLAGDPRLVDHIVGQVKSQGIFDQFRKECIADVDTKPAYQNLGTRVEGSVNLFLKSQTWKPDMNKNQLRETLRKHIHEASSLEVGVERIVDQVVNPKIYSVFMPQIEDVVYKFLGIERPKPREKNGPCNLKDLLPKDLDPVSPESDRNSLKDESLESMDINEDEHVNGRKDENKSETCEKVDDAKNEDKIQKTEEDKKPQDFKKIEEIKKIDETKKINENYCVEESIKLEEIKKIEDTKNGQLDIHENSMDVLEKPLTKTPSVLNLNVSFRSDDKTEEEEESPQFEPIDIMNLNESNISNDSHLSGISELTSHRSRSPDYSNEFSRDHFDLTNHDQDSQLSKVSSNSRLSIVTDFGSSNQASTSFPNTNEDSKDVYYKDNFRAIRDIEEGKYKESKFNFEAVKSNESPGEKDTKSLKSFSSKENSRDESDSISKEKIESRDAKGKSESKDLKEKSESRDGKEKCEYKDGKDKSDCSKSRRDKSDSRDSRRHRDSRKSSSSSSRHSKSRKERDQSREKRKDTPDKTKETSVKTKEDRKEKEEKDKDKEDKKEKEEKKEPEKQELLQDIFKDLKDIYKEKIRELREKKELTEKEKLNKDSKTTKDSKDRKDSSRDKKDYKKDHKTSRGSDRHDKSSKTKSNDSKDSKDRKRDERHHSKESKSRSSRNDKESRAKKEKSENKKDTKTESQSSKEKKQKDDKKSKSKDDHSSLRKNSNDRRSTDRDGSNGSNGKSSQKTTSTTVKSLSTTLTKETNSTNNSSGDTSNGIEDSQRNNDKIATTEFENQQAEINYKFSSTSIESPEKENSLKIESNVNELCLPLKKRPLHENSSSPSPSGEPKIKKRKFAKNVHEAKKFMKIRKRKMEKQNSEEDPPFNVEKIKIEGTETVSLSNSPLPDEDITKVPDEERVQIIEVPDEDCDVPYSGEIPNLTLEETTMIILQGESVGQSDLMQNEYKKESKLSLMEESIRKSLDEMMSDQKLVESSDAAANSERTIDTEVRRDLKEGETSEIGEESSVINTEESLIISEENEQNVEKVMGTEDNFTSMKSTKDKVEENLEKLERGDFEQVDISKKDGNSKSDDSLNFDIAEIESNDDKIKSDSSIISQETENYKIEKNKKILSPTMELRVSMGIKRSTEDLIRNLNLENSTSSEEDFHNINKKLRTVKVNETNSEKNLEIKQGISLINDKIEEQDEKFLTVSSAEEKCIMYFKPDNERYLKFSNFLKSFERELNLREEVEKDLKLNDEVDKEIGDTSEEKSKVKSMAPPQVKRKLSSSPLSDILLHNANNNNDRIKEGESVTNERSSPETPEKKRKLGRPKKQKPSISSFNPPGILNGENFVMPLSPESDVSATSEKTTSLPVKDDKSRLRNNQRYSSDDLYKPRPLFSSSSRRNRRSNQA